MTHEVVASPPHTEASAPRPWLALALRGGAAVGALLIAVATLAWLSSPAERELSLGIAGLEVNVPAPATTVSGVDVYLVRQPSGEVFVFLARDPHHRHCPVGPLRKTFWLEHEPTAAFDAGCTGSVFLADGGHVFGPSGRGLDRLASRTEGTRVILDVTRVVLGLCRADGSSWLACSTPDDPVTRRFDEWLASRW